MDKFKARMEKYPNGTTMPNLATQVQQMLPTPVAWDGNGGGARKPKDGKANALGYSLTLKDRAAAQMLPTPTRTDYKGAYPPTSINKHPARANMLRNVYQYEEQPYNSKTSQLSPLFVEEMMGFPENWTLLPFLNGEKNQSKPTETP